MTPAVSRPEPYEATHALDLIRRRKAISGRKLEILEYVVEQTLAGKGDQIIERTIAADVFARDLLVFDKRADSIVRTVVTQLRAKLLAYYAGPGREDPITIEIPAGTYVPKFSLRPRLSPEANSRLWSARVALQARTISGYEIAIKHLDSVLAEAPDFPVALAYKAEALASRAIHGSRPLPNLQEARVLAGRALARHEPPWQAWLAQGIVLQALERKWTEAGECYDKALELSGGDSASHVWYTAFLVGRGRPKEALSHLQRRVDHSGYSDPTGIGDFSMLLMLARDFQAAETTIQSAIEATPEYYQHYMNQAILLEAQGDPAGALRVLDRTPLKLHERPVTWGLRALFAGLSGSPEVARRRMTWLRAIQKAGRYIPPSQLAACRLGTGDPDGAVHWLEAAAEDHDPLVVWFHAYPFFRHLHGHNGFRDLIEGIGLVWY